MAIVQERCGLLEQFESGAIRAEEFHHRQHVEVVWLYLQRYPAEEVLVRFPEALKRFALSVGKANLYHATITWAFILLINERNERARFAGTPYSTFDDFAAANPDLLAWKSSILGSFYKKDTIASPLARATFVLPDHLAISR